MLEKGTDVDAVTIPNYKVAMKALVQCPFKSTKEEIRAVHFLYHFVLDKIAMKEMRHSPHNTDSWTCRQKLLGSKWTMSMATAIFLHKHYTDLDNIKQNISCGTKQGRRGEKRKRGRIFTRDRTNEFVADYYKLLSEMERWNAPGIRWDIKFSLSKWDGDFAPPTSAKNPNKEHPKPLSDWAEKNLS